MSSLIVCLPLAPATSATQWAYALTADGRTLADHGHSAAALLPLPRGAGAEVVALVPVQALGWHRVEWPRGIASGTPRLRAALDGLLEEQLLDDTDTVHLAVAPEARAGEPSWVATCDRSWLRNALQLLEAAGRPVARIVPEYAPEGSPRLVVLGEHEQPLVVASSAAGVLALPFSAATLPLLPELPPEAPRLAEPAVAALAEQLLQRPPQLQQAAQRWVEAARTRWDLAQFEFASSPRARLFKRLAGGWGEVLHGAPWRPARWAMLLLLAINLVGLNAWTWKERASLEASRDAVRHTLTSTFPQVKVVVDAPVQMERELALLRQQTGVASAGDLDALLAALAAAVPPGRVPTGLDYAGGVLRAAGLGLSTDELRDVATRLKGLGYTARAEGALLVLAAEDAR